MPQIIHHEPNGRASRVVECNGMLFFEGHVCSAAKDDPTLPMYDQAKMLLNRYEELLERYGSDKHHVIMVNIYMREASMAPEFNKAWDEWVDSGFEPARVTCTGLTTQDHYKLSMTMVAAKREEVKCR